MPEISLFYGIKVKMYYDDHNPPHFHAEYNDSMDSITRRLRCLLCWLGGQKQRVVYAKFE